MIEEKVLVEKFVSKKKKEQLKKLDWLKIRISDLANQNKVLALIGGLNKYKHCGFCATQN